MRRIVIYKQFGKTYATDEENFDKPITNASKEICMGNCDYDTAVKYFHDYCKTSDVVFIDKTR